MDHVRSHEDTGHLTLAGKMVDNIVVNGEEYFPRPDEIDPEFANLTAWHQMPWNPLQITDPKWYDGIGQDQIKQRRIWGISTESGQLDEIRKLLHEFPERGRDMLYSATIRGKTQIVRFLLDQGTRIQPDSAENDDPSIQPVHAAAYQGRLNCLKLFLEEEKIMPDVTDEFDATPLMRALLGRHVEIIKYLLEAGADLALRQNTIKDNVQKGFSVFECAAMSGCHEGAQLLVKRAEELGINPCEFYTPMALELAAFNVCSTELLGLVLDLGRYPHPNTPILANVGDAEELDLSEEMKVSLEKAVPRALLGGKLENMQVLYTYIASKTSKGEYNWKALKTETTNDLRYVMLHAIRQRNAENDAKFFWTWDVLFNSRFAVSGDYKDKLLHTAFHDTARWGNVDMMKWIVAAKRKDLDVNRSSDVRSFRGATPVSVAAMYGHREILEYLFDEFGDKIDVHIGQGQHLNGQTALWESIGYGQPDVTKVLLERSEGPVDYIDPTLLVSVVSDTVSTTASIGLVEEQPDTLASSDEQEQQPTKKAQRIIMTITRRPRYPVSIISERTWIEEHGEIDPEVNKSSIPSKTDDAEDNVIFLVLEFPEDYDMKKMLSNLKPRKSDEQLLKEDKLKRELKRDTTPPVPEIAVEGEGIEEGVFTGIKQRFMNMIGFGSTM